MGRALLLVDVIKDFEHEDGDRLLASFRERHSGLTHALAEARQAGTPVVYANDGARRWTVPVLLAEAFAGRAGGLVREIAPQGSEPVLLKEHYSGFDGTSLAAVLRDLDANEIDLAGTATELCVFDTATDAARAGLDVTVLADACASVDARHEALALAYLREVLGVRVSTRPS